MVVQPEAAAWMVCSCRDFRMDESGFSSRSRGIFTLAALPMKAEMGLEPSSSVTLSTMMPPEWAGAKRI